MTLLFIHIFYITYILEQKANVIVTEISASIGHLAIIIIPYLKCFSSKRENKKTKKMNGKNYLLHYFIFFIIYFGHLSLLMVCSKLKPNSKKKNNIMFLTTDVHDFYCIGSIEIIFIIFVSLLLLKNKYFIHHYICLFTFIILSISIDYLLDNFHYKLNREFFYYLAMCLLQLLVESISLSYQKYMFDKLYYSPYKVCFAFGVIFLLYNLGSIGIFLIIGDREFLEYFKNVNIGFEIFKFISNIIMVFLVFLSMALTNYYFSPNHLVANYELGNMIIFLMNSKSKTKYYSLFLFILQLFILMIFLEIIELNFCGLNKNTKRNIQIRANEDIQEANQDEDLIEVSPGYYIHKDDLDYNLEYSDDQSTQK